MVPLRRRFFALIPPESTLRMTCILLAVPLKESGGLWRFFAPIPPESTLRMTCILLGVSPRRAWVLRIFGKN